MMEHTTGLARAWQCTIAPLLLVPLEAKLSPVLSTFLGMQMTQALLRQIFLVDMNIT